MTQAQSQSTVLSELDNASNNSGVGARLKAAREAAGMTVSMVSTHLKLTIKQIEALENENYAALPSGVFVRGFVRRYARLLQLDEVLLMQAMEVIFPRESEAEREAGASPVVDRSAIEPRMHKNRVWPWALGGLIICVVIVLLVWQTQEHKAVVTSPAEGAHISAGDSAGEMKSANTANTTSLPNENHASMPHQSVVVPESSNRLANEVKTASTSASSAVTKTLVLSVKDEAAWVSVKDAEGKKLLFTTLAPGARQTITGMPPFSVILGNAPNVQLNYDNHPIDFSDKIHGMTARFKLE